jgi:predicted RND superfamily exporter protein
MVMAFAASKIQVNPNLAALMPENERLNALMDKYDPGSKEKDPFLLALEVKGELTIEALQTYEEVIKEVNELTGGFSSSIFNAITFKKSGGRLAPLPLLPSSRAPRNQEEFNIYKENLKNDLFSNEIFFTDNGNKYDTLFFHTPSEDELGLIEPYYEIVKKLDPYFTTHTTGTIFLTQRSAVYLSQDLFKLLSLALIAILIFYYIGFHSKRAVFLPMTIVVFGTIWALGMMGILGFELTMISIVIPPLVLTIGTSYAIHFLNQYYHDAETDHKDSNWIVEASLHVNMTIIMAALTTVIGFMSLLFTSMEASRNFGLSTSIGIVACAILSLTFLPASLSRMKSPDHVQKKRVRHGKFTTFMGGLSDIVYRFRIVFTVLFFAIAVLFFISYPKITHQSDYVSYFPEGDPEVSSLNFIMKNFAGVQRLNLTISAPEGSKNYFLEPENLKIVSLLEKEIGTHKDVMKISSFPGIIRDLNFIMTGKNEIPESRGLMLLMSRYFKALSSNLETGLSNIMVNEDFSRINLTIMMYNHESNAFLAEDGLRNLIKFIEINTETALNEDLTSDIWGYDLEFLDLAENVNKDQLLSTSISIILVLIISSFFFKSIIYGLVTLIPLLSGLMLNFIFMVFLKIPLDITTMMVSSVAIGVGVDDAIHYLLQFKRQMLMGGSIKDVLHSCGKISGRPIALTTASIVCGLMVLTLASFKGIAYFGALVSFTLTFTMIGTLIILPAMLSLLVKIKLIKS